MVKHRLLEYTVPPLDIVHIGIVGLGNRGMKAVGRYELVPGAEIVALADHKESSTITANRTLIMSGPRASCAGLCRGFGVRVHRLAQSCSVGGHGNAQRQTCGNRGASRHDNR